MLVSKQTSRTARKNYAQNLESGEKLY